MQLGDPVHLFVRASAAALEVCAIVREAEPIGLHIGHTAVKGNDEVLNGAGTPYHSIGIDGRPADIFGEELSKAAGLHRPEVVAHDAACLLLRRHMDPPSVAWPSASAALLNMPRG
jgi:hypothetical protein